MKQPPPYLSVEELCALIPFSTQAIRMYVHRHELCEGVHFFRVGRRLVFKWSAVCDWIEGRAPVADATAAPVLADIVPVRRHV